MDTVARRALLAGILVTLAVVAGCGGENGPPNVGLDQLAPRDRPATSGPLAETPPDAEAPPRGPAERPGYRPIARTPGRSGEEASGQAAAEGRRTIRLGRSVEGQPITARVIGDPTAARAMVVIGCIHGDEPAGIAVTESLRDEVPPGGVAIWLVDEFNPDGCAAGRRQNANGVDLNRNSSWNWEPIGSPGGIYYSGKGPLSEPESQAIRELVAGLQPAISIWYHQHAELVDRSGGDPAIESRYAELVGLPYESFGRYPGSITSWQNHAFPDDTAFVVELPAGPLSPEAAEIHVDAVLALASGLANRR